MAKKRTRLTKQFIGFSSGKLPERTRPVLSANARDGWVFLKPSGKEDVTR